VRIFDSALNEFTFAYFVLATHHFKVLRLIDPLLGNDHETSNETTAVAREQIELQQSNGVLYAVRAEMSSRRVWKFMRLVTEPVER
jgi:hypothetical protein